VRRSPMRMLTACTIAIPLIAQTGLPAAIHATPIPAFSSHPASHLGLLPASQLASFAGRPTQRVIVLLRDGTSGDPLARAAAALTRASQGPLLRELATVRATGVLPYRLINAVAATVSPAEAARLAGDPAVRAVVPDRIIRLTRPDTGARPAAGLLPPPAPARLQPNDITPACTLSKTPSLEPQALQLTSTAANNPNVLQARHLRTPSGAPITGAGVKVAYIAEGIDTNNPDLIRPNGQHVFVDYKDFSGDGPNAPTGGGEAFLDASSIAAQGRKVYDVNDYLINPLPRPCPIRIQGMAPGASLVGLKVFATNNTITTEAFVQAIDYAVTVAHVDVLNESFGSNPFPDLRKDPTSLANAAAIAAGVTVVASSGDAGANGTIGSPATAPGVISAGATTQFRAYSQTAGAGITLGNGGYLDNNIAGLSSAGFSQVGPRTIDVVAPGDSGWVLCTPSTTDPPAFSNCTNLAGKPASFVLSGGTSESAPLTAGEAALVIQAYRSTHHGSSPSPALVKRLIMSSATDLGVPAQEQGAGLINSYRAVQLAFSYRDPQGSPSPRANALLSGDLGAFSATAGPDSAQRVAFTVTNSGGKPQVVAPKVRSLSRVLSTRTYSRYFDPLAQGDYFFDDVGVRRTYIEQDLRVPAGAQRLQVSLAFLAGSQPGSILRIDLFDPSGRFAAFSDPQGYGTGYSQAAVRQPQPGTWRAIVWTRAAPTVNSYFGPLQITATSSTFAPSGTVSPASRMIAPGHSATFIATVRTPSQPGDRGDEIVFPSPSGRTTLLGAIPVSLRSLVPLGTNGGGFNGVLLGGNGRAGAPGQGLSYQFDVPVGVRDLNLGVRITDPNSNLEGVLVDPSGQPVDVQTTVAAITQQGVPSFYTGAMQFTRHAPPPGRYLFVLLINKTIAGAATSQRFQARIAFNQAHVMALGVPNSPSVVLPAGKPVRASVEVTNNGITSKDFFLDARLQTSGPVPLLAPYSFSTALPITPKQAQQLPAFVIPPHVTQADFSAISPTAISLDVSTNAGAPPYGGTGAPESAAASGSIVDPATGLYTAAVSVQAPEVAPTAWSALPAQLGPFGASAPSSTVEVRATAIGEPFDQAVAVSTGNPFDPFSPPYKPLTLPPSFGDVISVRITPRGLPGTIVRGTLYVETFNLNSSSGDELAAIPYAYTVGR